MQANDLNANTQSATSPIVDNLVEGNSGGEVHSANVLADNFGSPLPLDDQMAIDTTSIIVQQGGTSSGEIMEDDDGGADEKVAFATALLNEQLEKISLANLENILYIFRQVLEGAPPGHALRFDTLQSHIFASGLKYICKRDQETLLELQCLHCLLEKSYSSAPTVKRGTEDDELRDMVMLGKAAWEKLLGSISPVTIDTITYLLRQSLDEIPADDERRAGTLTTLSYAIYLQIHRSEVSAGLEIVALMLERAVSGEQQMNTQIANVAILLTVTLSMIVKYGRKSTRTDGDSGVASLDSDRSGAMDYGPYGEDFSLLDYGKSLLESFEMNGNVDVLQNGIEMTRLSLTEISFKNPQYSAGLNNLANGLFTRFQQLGDPHDLDESVSLHRQALDLRPPPHPNRFASLNNLAGALSTRFEQRGDSHDLDESITLHRQALNLLPSPHAARSMSLNNLAVGLSTRFEQRGDPHDLDECITLHRQALDLCPSPHPRRSGSLNNLANGLYTRFEQRGDPHNLDESITLHRQALDLRPSPRPDRSMSLNNLANGLYTRFEQQGDPHDLDESITLHRQALDLCPPPHPHRSISLNNLANELFTQFEQQDNPHDLHCALKHISEAANSTSVSPSNRYKYARRWALRANQYHHSSALQAFDLALSLIPQLVALGLDIQARQDTLSRHGDGLAGYAAQCAINLGDFPKAVEFLETGRSVFWSQFLSLRSPLDKLKDVSPDLARDLHSISQQLEKGSHREQNSATLSNREKLSLEAEANKYTKLAQDWDRKVDEVRQLDGFQDFLRPKQFSALQAAAVDGPIIYFIASQPASHCLIITATNVHHILLPELPSDALAALLHLVKLAASDQCVPRLVVESTLENLPANITLVQMLRQLKGDKDRGMRPETGLPNYISSDDIFQFVLYMLWGGAVEPVIDALGLTKSDNPPKVTWCTTGLFSFLPIHAAGCYYVEDKVECASEYFISTYTPTIEALLTPHPPSMKSFQMMAVIQSATLPSTLKELERIEHHVPKSALKKFGILGAPATMDSVASNLSTASLVHFACHGKQDPVNPLQSGLQIGGERLTIGRIMKESIPNGSLAFLSACETAAGDEKIPDEAMNIASSLLFTGFRKVVATMWRMWDEDGPVIADAFYKELFTGPDGSRLEVPDTSKSAKALWVAVNELRSKGVEFRRWVPFIHIGK